MRVIAGEKGGRRLVAPVGLGTRPTSDRVREAAFSMLESALADRRSPTDGPRSGDVWAGAVVWDLFAGSGALGIEALSRGAAHVVFVDQARAAVSVIKQNLVKLGYGPERSHIFCAEVLRWVHGLDEGRTGVEAVLRGADVVLADPPYAWRSWSALLQALAPLGALVLMEAGTEPELAEGWGVLRSRRYGGTLVTLSTCKVSRPETSGPGTGQWEVGQP